MTLAGISADFRTEILGILVIISALAVPAVQIYMYLRSGDWQSWSVITPLSWAGLGWAVNPQSWYGLHQVLDWVHVSFGIIAVSPLLFYLSQLYYEVDVAIENAADEAKAEESRNS